MNKQPTPEYSRNNRSHKFSNLLTKFFPAGGDRSHFLLRVSVRGAEGKNCLAGFTCLDLKRRLSERWKQQRRAQGTSSWNREEAKREVHSPSHSDLPPRFLFWLFWEARLRASRRGWNPNWRNPDATGLKSAPAPLPSSLQAFLLASSLLSWGFNTRSSIVLTVGPLEISFAVLWGLRGLPRWAPKLIPVSS